MICVSHVSNTSTVFCLFVCFLFNSFIFIWKKEKCQWGTVHKQLLGVWCEERKHHIFLGGYSPSELKKTNKQTNKTKQNQASLSAMKTIGQPPITMNHNESKLLYPVCRGYNNKIRIPQKVWCHCCETGWKRFKPRRIDNLKQRNISLLSFFFTRNLQICKWHCVWRQKEKCAVFISCPELIVTICYR